MPAGTPPAGAGSTISTSPASGLTMRDYIRQQAEKLQIPGDLALAITQTESGGQHGAISPKGATGFFQLMPETAKSLGVDASDPFQNIDGGLKYFKQQLDAHGGDVRLALAAYNAGPARTAGGQVPQIPETQDYVLTVLKAWQGGAGATTATASGGAPSHVSAVTTEPPAAASAGMLPASPITKQHAPPSNLFESAIAAPVTGFGQGVGKLLADTGRTIEKVTGASLPDLPPGNLEARSTGESLGQFVEGAAEFAVPEAAIGKATKALQITQRLLRAGVAPSRARLIAAAAGGSVNALSAAGISTLHGDDPTTSAAIAGLAPVASALVTEMAPAIRTAAKTRMARFLERGMSGDITPELQKTVAQAASDFVDLPLKRTWRQMAAQTRGLRTQAGKSLESALAGPLGDVPVAKAPIYTALDDLVTDTAQHLVPVKGGVRTVTFRPDVTDAISDLKALLNEYGDTLPARQLHDIKQTWWKAIYPIREAAQPIGSVRELLTSGQKEAHLRGAKAIADVLKQDVPQLAALDEAVSHAARLDQLTKRLAAKARTGTLAKPAARYAVKAAGGAVGIGAGSLVGHPIVGAHIGYATASMLMSAVESPKWRLLPIATRTRLASALASGNAQAAQQILTPFVLSTTADQDNLLSPSNSASSASASR